MVVPVPTYIKRIIHLDNLPIYLQRGGIHAWNHTPKDGHSYKIIHNVDIQSKRHRVPVPCGPCGVIHDYVPFYFGHLSPMLLQLKTGQVSGYTEGQEPIIHLVSSAQLVQSSGIDFVFTDGHGIVQYTDWFDDLACLQHVDWKMINERYWAKSSGDTDRQRRKQAEFLVHRFLPWDLLIEIVVI